MSSWLTIPGGEIATTQVEIMWMHMGLESETGNPNNIGFAVFCIGFQLAPAHIPPLKTSHAKNMSSSTVSMEDFMKQRSKMLYPTELQLWVPGQCRSSRIWVISISVDLAVGQNSCTPGEHPPYDQTRLLVGWLRMTHTQACCQVITPPSLTAQAPMIGANGLEHRVEIHRRPDHLTVTPGHCWEKTWEFFRGLVLDVLHDLLFLIAKTHTTDVSCGRDEDMYQAVPEILDLNDLELLHGLCELCMWADLLDTRSAGYEITSFMVLHRQNNLKWKSGISVSDPCIQAYFRWHLLERTFSAVVSEPKWQDPTFQFSG